MARWLLHVDLDQFQAAVEFRRRPDLRGLPVIVGGNGDPAEPRKVVTCASYTAREYGVRAGMPLRTAARKCPAGVFVPLDMAAYEAASDDVMTVLRHLRTDRAGCLGLEVWGWDEAFLAAETDDPEHLAADIRVAISALGLTCSVGVGDNKSRAKLATGFAKRTETGVYRLTGANWWEVMADRPVDALWGIGKRIAGRLATLDITTVAQLARADRELLAAEFGPATGPWLRALGQGGGATDVATEPRVSVGRSHSRTFPQDLTDAAQIRAEVAALASVVAHEASTDGRVTVRVAVTVRTATFHTRTKQRKLPAPTVDMAAIVDVALQILDRFELDRPIRLLGVRLEFAPVSGSPESRTSR